MDENQENKVEETKQEPNFKQETVNTFNEAKEEIKNINFMEGAQAGKGLLLKLWKNPIQTIKDIANDKENKHFSTALFLVAMWVMIEFADIFFYYVSNKYATFSFLPTLKTIIAPILNVIAMTLAIYIVNNRAKTSISKVLTSVSVAYVPSIISSVVWLLYRFSTKMYTILSPVGGLLNVITLILMYNTVKEFVKKDNEESAFKDFVKVEAVYYIIVFAISFLGISL